MQNSVHAMQTKILRRLPFLSLTMDHRHNYVIQ
jgi:hypothetical protein